MNAYISGEKLQELADLTVIFTDQNHEDLWTVQIHNTSCDYVILKPNDILPDKIFKAKSIFVYTHALPLFFKRVFPLLTAPVVLITHNSDHGIDGRYIEYLNDNRIIKWFCQNRLTSHPKLFSIPIGIANSQWEHGDQKTIQNIIQDKNKKEFLVYKNFDIDTNSHERNMCHAITQQNGIPLSSRTTIPAYWEMLSKSAFVISPPGGGVDCHRIWEALYFKTVPIVQQHESFSQFKHLPILFIQKWEEVTVPYLRENINKFKEQNWDLNELNINFWRQRFAV